MNHFDNELKEYMDAFFGYGDLNAPIWFIGMEEGGGDSLGNIKRRLNAWQKLGCSTVLDIAEFHKEIGDFAYFENENTAKLQPTWNKLIRYMLAYEGHATNLKNVRKFQVNRLGRFASQTCLLELMPLPSPKVSDWLYKDISDLPELISRELYTQKISPNRIMRLSSFINQYQPKRVVFYSKSYARIWSKFVSAQAKWENKQDMSFVKENSIEYFILPHPVAPGVSNKFYEDCGSVRGMSD